jgi:hypothetical protein
MLCILLTICVLQVLVLHGGLFYTEGVTLQDLSEIDRLEYVVPSKNEDIIDEVSKHFKIPNTTYTE